MTDNNAGADGVTLKTERMSTCILLGGGGTGGMGWWEQVPAALTDSKLLGKNDVSVSFGFRGEEISCFPVPPPSEKMFESVNHE